ncbi:MAG: DNA (cytosine-5-)-methyltransferase [Candidatus Doudnabacteria bacterium CG10_big_fil_rev_8_21_14_0_10_41_10]|uniref:DNA (Cytosine-5-)-methyltransferase n=1 Tax=Candidatus Doudnabacteria bacterium CG10_big_fil_rev_8_21_14_0_10_41_10 TaxID=1974551 RepID=A0A2H0VFG4_9BACT|nr:MAG: DNA (cytosine-5-)-methyltransferase [Candidatus Doudnabacteria bacterium CG10_big_fil_rev_8_21_14_0_10_41_10]
MGKVHFTTVLRKNQSPWEAKLWNVIRAKRLGKIKFRRQVKIDNFIVDFLCPSRKLIIELDGEHHNWDKFKKKDLLRQKKLEEKGYRVLRFWNNDIDRNLEGVVTEINKYL